MKRFNVMAVMAAIVLVGCSGGESPISLVQGKDAWSGNPNVTITAVSDNVSVQEVKFNRGNCEAGRSPERPFVLKFGESATVLAFCSSVIEADIGTDKGAFSFSF